MVLLYEKAKVLFVPLINTGDASPLISGGLFHTGIQWFVSSVDYCKTELHMRVASLCHIAEIALVRTCNWSTPI